MFFEMGRAARWFKRLFGFKKSKSRSRVSGSDGDDSGDNSIPTEPVWSRTFLTDTEKEQNKHAIAVATAATTAAEAAVSAALAAAAAVKLTSVERAGDIITTKEHWAALKIQKVFKGCLARKALRALKGLVKLQALVRGYLVRKRAAAMLQRIQTLIRVQTTLRSNRINRCLNDEYNDAFQPREPLDKLDEASYGKRSPKIVEMDDIHRRRSNSRSKSRQGHNVAAMSGYGDNFVYNGNDLELSFSGEKWKFPTAQNTPRFSSSTHHHTPNNRYYVPQSPAKSVCGNALADHGMITPGYMEKTQSFKAKLRSHSAPRQRSDRKRLSLDDVMVSRSSVSGMSMEQQQRYSNFY